MKLGVKLADECLCKFLLEDVNVNAHIESTTYLYLMYFAIF